MMYHAEEKNVIKKIQEFKISKRQDLLVYYNQENLFEVFVEIFMNRYLQILVPIVYFQMTKKKMEVKKIQKRQRKLTRLQTREHKIKDSANSTKSKISKSTTLSMNNSRLKNREEAVKIYEAVKICLSNRDPDFRIKQSYMHSMTDQYIITHLPIRFLKMCLGGGSVSDVFNNQNQEDANITLKYLQSLRRETTKLKYLVSINLDADYGGIPDEKYDFYCQNSKVNASLAIESEVKKGVKKDQDDFSEGIERSFDDINSVEFYNGKNKYYNTPSTTQKDFDETNTNIMFGKMKKTEVLKQKR